MRQASSHYDWLRSQLGWEEPERALTTIVSYKQTIDPNAAAIAGDLHLVSPQVVREIGARTFAVHREIRARARGLSDQQLDAAFAQEFRSRQLHSGGLTAQLSGRRIAAG